MNKYQLCIALVAVTAIAITEIFAIVYHIDGRTLGLSFAAVAGIAGYKIAKFK